MTTLEFESTFTKEPMKNADEDTFLFMPLEKDTNKGELLFTKSGKDKPAGLYYWLKQDGKDLYVQIEGDKYLLLVRTHEGFQLLDGSTVTHNIMTITT